MKKNNNGIALVLVLFLLMILAMFSSGILVLTMNQQHNSWMFYNNLAALRAAEAGTFYAMTRMCKDPAWKGFPRNGNPECHILKNGVDVYEHQIDGERGCIEGKLQMGDNWGYFDLYFKRPPDDTGMVFIKADGEAGPLPQKMTLCCNNNVLAGGITECVPVLNLDETPASGKIIPGNAVYVCCRGRVGNVEKIVECSFTITPIESSNSVLLGEGDVDITIEGRNPTDQLVLGYDASGVTRPSIMRSGGCINLGQVSNRDDYLLVSDGSSGKSDIQPTFSPQPVGFENFQLDPGQGEKVLRMPFSVAKPETSSEEVTLPAGIYMIEARKTGETNPPSPVITYFETDKTQLMRQDQVDWAAVTCKDKTTDFESLFADGKMKWDPEKCKLTICEPCKVTSCSSAGGTIKNLALVSNGKNYFKVQIGEPSADPGNTQEENEKNMYLMNENDSGSIFIGGQLTGSGSVFSTGGLDIQAESQLEASAISGISIYSGSDVNVNQISRIEQYVSELADIAKEKNENLADPPGTDPGTDPGNDPGGEPTPPPSPGTGDDPYITAYNKIVARYEELKAQGAQYGTIPKSAFTAEEVAVLTNNTNFNFRFNGGTNLGIYTGTAVYGSLWGPGDVYYPVSDKDANASYTSFVKLSPNYDPGATPTPTPSSTPSSTPTPAPTPGPTTPPSVLNYRNRPVVYEDSIFRGLVYTCGNFNVLTPDHSFILEGGLVASGSTLTGSDSPLGGKIDIDAADCSFLYDSRYLSLLSKMGNNEIKILYWSNGDIGGN